MHFIPSNGLRKLDISKRSSLCCSQFRKFHINLAKATSNDLFLLRTGEGYQRFSKHACAYGMEWCSFVGATHIIPTEDEHALQKTAQAQTPDKTRELPQAIPYKDRDFEPIKQQPANVQFQDEHYGSKLEDEDPTIIMVNKNKPS